MALGTGLGAAYTQIAAAPDYSLRIAPLRLELAPGRVIDTYGYNGTVPAGAAPARRPPGQHRYPQRHGRRRHHPLARSLPALDGRWRHGRDRRWWGAAARSASFVRGKAHRNALVPQPARRCRNGINTKYLCRTATLHGEDETNDPGRSDQEVLLAATTGKAPGSASRISAEVRRPTTAWR